MKYLSEEAKRKMYATFRGKPSPRRGKHLSEETKRKLFDALMLQNRKYLMCTDIVKLETKVCKYCQHKLN